MGTSTISLLLLELHHNSCNIEFVLLRLLKMNVSTWFAVEAQREHDVNNGCRLVENVNVKSFSVQLPNCIIVVKLQHYSLITSLNYHNAFNIVLR